VDFHDIWVVVDYDPEKKLIKFWKLWIRIIVIDVKSKSGVGKPVTPVRRKSPVDVPVAVLVCNDSMAWWRHTPY